MGPSVAMPISRRWSRYNVCPCLTCVPFVMMMNNNEANDDDVCVPFVMMELMLC